MVVNGRGQSISISKRTLWQLLHARSVVLVIRKNRQHNWNCWAVVWSYVVVCGRGYAHTTSKISNTLFRSACWARMGARRSEKNGELRQHLESFWTHSLHIAARAAIGTYSPWASSSAIPHAIHRSSPSLLHTCCWQTAIQRFLGQQHGLHTVLHKHKDFTSGLPIPHSIVGDDIFALFN